MWDLVLQPEIKPRPTACGVLATAPPGKSLPVFLIREAPRVVPAQRKGQTPELRSSRSRPLQQLLFLTSIWSFVLSFFALSLLPSLSLSCLSRSGSEAPAAQRQALPDLAPLTCSASLSQLLHALKSLPVCLTHRLCSPHPSSWPGGTPPGMSVECFLSFRTIQWALPLGSPSMPLASSCGLS